MRALILAAGRGTRLGLLTETTPKALMEVDGEALIARLVRQCAAAGVHEVHVVVGHEPDQIGQLLADLEHDVTITFVHNQDYATTNNIVSLRLGLEALQNAKHRGDLLLIECDVLLDDSVLQRLVGSTVTDCAVVSPFQAGMDGTVVRLDGAHIRELITTSRQGPFFRYDDTYKTVNVYKLSYRVWSSKLARLIDWYIDEIGTGAYYENAIGMIAYASGNALSAMMIPPEKWDEIDDPNDLRVARSKASTPTLAAELSRSHGGWWDFDVVDFSYLRNLHFPPPALIAQLRQRLEAAIVNYGSSQPVLDEKMSWFLETPATETVALGGLSSLYPLLVDFLDRSDALIPAPTFGEYRHRFPRAGTYDARAAAEEIGGQIERERPAHVVIVNPNNPTGSLLLSHDVAMLAAGQPAVTFWVDESFLPFTAERSLTRLPSTPDNVVVLGSLSKSLGVPGLRLGFAWSRMTGLPGDLRRRLPIWAMSSVAEIFLILALKFKVEYATSLTTTVADKAMFEAALAAVPGVSVVPEVHGNFILAEARDLPAQRSGDLVMMLLERRLLTKDVTERLDRNHPTLRIAVRTPEENLDLARELTACLASLSRQ
jgi:histidinol-phosphate/aromatic aminotransferase/cobyric acid decarboxylase-like protein/choline kinase